MYRNYDTPGCPTFFDGYWFSSRLEARWAVYLDYLGVNFQYEEMRFTLPPYKYLPDFEIWDEDSEEFFWLEIKPSFPIQCEIDKMAKLVSYDCKTGVILYSPQLPPPWQHTTYGHASNVGMLVFDPIPVRDEVEPKHIWYWNSKQQERKNKFPTFKRSWQEIDEALETAIHINFDEYSYLTSLGYTYTPRNTAT